MNKLGFMTLASFAISFMMVIASFAANTGGSDSTENPGIFSGSSSGMESEEGSPAMSSDWDNEYGIAPEYRGEEFKAPSDQGMPTDPDRERGLAPEYRGTDFDTFSKGMSTDQDRDYGVYSVTPDKDPNAPY